MKQFCDQKCLLRFYLQQNQPVMVTQKGPENISLGACVCVCVCVCVFDCVFVCIGWWVRFCFINHVFYCYTGVEVQGAKLGVCIH